MTDETKTTMNPELNETKLSPAVLRIIRRAAVEAEASNSPEVGIPHILIGIVQEGRNVGAQLLAEKDVTVEQLRELNFKT